MTSLAKHLLLFLCLQLVGISAGPVSSCYERAYFWGAHRLDRIASAGLGAHKIVPGYSGTQFHEFIDHLFDDPSQQVPQVTMANPSATYLAKLQYDSGIRGFVDWQKVLPGANIESHSQGFRAINSRLGVIKEILRFRGQMGDFNKELEFLKEAFDHTIKFREYEDQEGEARHAQKYGRTSQPKVAVPVKEIQDPKIGFRWKIVDKARGVASNPGLNEGFENWLDKWRTEVYHKRLFSISHRTLIEELKALRPTPGGCKSRPKMLVLA